MNKIETASKLSSIEMLIFCIRDCSKTSPKYGDASIQENLVY